LQVRTLSISSAERCNKAILIPSGKNPVYIKLQKKYDGRICCIFHILYERGYACWIQFYIFTSKDGSMIQRYISLKDYNTFGLDYRSSIFIRARSEEEAVSDIRAISDFSKPILVLGGGSNLLFIEDYDGIIIHPEIPGINIEEDHPGHVIVSAGAGVIWDNLVKWSVEKGLGGLENLSLIPGMIGAVPVQNIGAYGKEAKDVIEKVRCISLEDASVRKFSSSECCFGYRSSIFKTDLKRKYMISRVYFRLFKQPVFNLDYGTLREEVSRLGGTSLRNIRDAVIAIRSSKLPDPRVKGNAGSFFKNPVVDSKKAEFLRENYPNLPCYSDSSGGVKISAGWLIEQCGWKGKSYGNAGVYEKQALVLVNSGGASGKEIYGLAEKIRKSVLDKFGVELEREVEVVGTI
jgi:UDP-N-acetylmuramate dehydrogenase